MKHSDFFAVLGDPTRFRIVEALREGERQVADLVMQSSVQQSGVSRHLGILRDAGLVRVRQDGQRRLYSLREEPFREASAWMQGIRDVWEPRLDRLGRELEKRKQVLSEKNKRKEK